MQASVHAIKAGPAQSRARAGIAGVLLREDPAQRGSTQSKRRETTFGGLAARASVCIGYAAIKRP